MSAQAKHGRVLPALREWESRIFEGVTLSEEDRRLADRLRQGGEGRLEVDELRTGLRVRAKAWVGVVRFESVEIRIAPKLAGDQLGLVRLLECVSGLDAFRRPKGDVALEVSGSDLLDLVSLLLAEATEEVVRRGLLAGYVEREDAIPVVRGRILADQQILRRYGAIDRVQCRFDELEHDVDENRLLAAALRLATRRTGMASLHRRLSRLRAVFDPICQPELLNLRTARKALIYNRLNSHYQRAHELAWLVFEGLGVDDLLAAGSTRSFAFLLDMNRLFERFVERLVEASLSTSEYRVETQRRYSLVIRDADTGAPRKRVIPDVVVHGRGRARGYRTTIDAKYKLYDEKPFASSDIYQSFLYAYALGSAADNAVPESFLFYPASEERPKPARLVVRPLSARRGAEITALGISIPAALAELQAESGGPVKAAIRRLVEHSLGDPDASPEGRQQGLA